MKIRYTIHPDNRGRSMPLERTALIVVALKAFSAPQWLWGAAAMLIIYLWYAFVKDVREHREQSIDLFTQLKEKKPNGKDRVQDGTISKISS
jgi:hypothetical protein